MCGSVVYAENFEIKNILTYSSDFHFESLITRLMRLGSQLAMELKNSAKLKEPTEMQILKFSNLSIWL